MTPVPKQPYTGDRRAAEDSLAQLRARQGSGARYDAPEAPAEALLNMRRGTAYVARLIDALPDTALSAEAASTVARMGYHARALTRLLDGAALWEDAAKRAAEQALGETLPPRALRALFAHASRHLDVRLRDLPGSDWGRTLADGSLTSDLPRRHADLLWKSSLTLGGRSRDIPRDLT